ncbi:hypothetical protein OROHE_008063 [Orobanche hederae]
MGFFQIMIGVIGGVYLAQNYDLPNIKNLFMEGKRMEERHKIKGSATNPKDY